MEQAYDLYTPERRDTAFVFAAPHSGRHYSERFLASSVLSPASLRSSEDAFVDRLFDAAPRHGAPLLVAHWPRAYVDVNRAPDELDPALIDGLRRAPTNPRVASGLGVVPRVVSGGRAIYQGKIGLDDARGRIRDIWRPYHDCLDRLMQDSRRAFGRAVLIDCHSMPHEALDQVRVAGKRPNVVLGDRYGAAAAADVVDLIEDVFTESGLVVSRNAPFAGAYVAQHYGRPGREMHVVQVELDRRLYMDEAAVAPHGGFADVKATIDGVVRRICDIGRVAGRAHAAE